MTKDKVLLIIMILLGMTLIPLGDTAGKLLMQAGVSPLFVAWSRLFMGFLVILPLSGIKLSEVSLTFNWRLLLRAGLFLCAVTLILKAVETESIANVFGAFFIGPIISYFLAALVLKEEITLLRSTLLLIGFAGALMVIKPGFGMTQGMGLAALSGCFYGCFLVTNRWLAGSFRPRFILLTTLFSGSIVLAPLGIAAIPEFNLHISGLLLISALASAFGNLIIIEANRKLPASVVAPFVYTQLIAATFFSIVVFDSWPDILSLIGLSILFISGLASFILSNNKPISTVKET
ncbi:MAG: drug/metabolite transporter (DMT)-like permease [Enterobacterales bacterium]|jgi:drug/metabolite transporter (DMT)-like permease